MSTSDTLFHPVRQGNLVGLVGGEARTWSDWVMS